MIFLSRLIICHVKDISKQQDKCIEFCTEFLCYDFNKLPSEFIISFENFENKFFEVKISLKILF